MSNLLTILRLTPSAQSDDYVRDKRQFHLYGLLTEQRHPKTWNLSFAVQADVQAGLNMLLEVDRDISRRLRELVDNPSLLDQAAQAVTEAVAEGRRVYFYGCGATGRLAKQMESAFWRPFWRRVRRHPLWTSLRHRLPPDIGERVVGEMTGADRALVSSLEGFEDLQLIGRLQLEDHGIQAGDVVICVTEGGETSSVIGTILSALAQYRELDACRLDQARRNLYFVYNNPDEVLRPFERSAAVLDQPAITRINLTTGPQAITGSTRMQATTIETFVLGAVLEEAAYRILRPHLSAAELRELGYSQELDLSARLAAFDEIKAAVDSSVGPLAELTELEFRAYREGCFATYFAREALITVFIDNTERSPTFRLFPLDPARETRRQCWVQVWTEAENAREAWLGFLGRRFRGLEEERYRLPFEREVADPYLREAALRSLAHAGSDQETAYDFSFSAFNIEHRGPRQGDLGVLVAVDDEAQEIGRSGSAFHTFAELVRGRGARLAVLVTSEDRNRTARIAGSLRPEDVMVPVILKAGDDPLTLRRQVALKMMLNAHSTAVMAAMGRVIGNTMTNVSPSNLKLVGRATYLIMTHVNDTISGKEWVAREGPREPASFAEANAVLFDAIDYVHTYAAGQTAEVALSVVRIIEALRRRDHVGWDDAQAILEREGLAGFLARHNPSLSATPG